MQIDVEALRITSTLRTSASRRPSPGCARDQATCQQGCRFSGTPRQRKESYIRHLPDASDDAILVSLADKLDNARAILRDFRAHGDELWQRFNEQDPQLHLWYYRSLLEVYAQRIDNWMVDELREVVDALERAIRQSA